MTRIHAALIVLAALAGTAGPSAAPPQDPPQAPPAFRTGVEAVNVDVSVLDDDGQPVPGLTAPDFTVTVAGRPRRVVSATFVDASPETPAVPGGPAALLVSSNDAGSFGRLIVFVMDQGTLDQSEVRQVADSAGRLFDRLTPADRSALVLMPVGKGLSFTADHARVREALRRASGLAGVSIESSRLAGLDEIRAIASGDFRALQTVALRECGQGPDEGTGIVQGPAAPVPGPGQPGGQDGGGRNGTGSNTGEAAFSSADSCTRRIQGEAMSVWHQVHAAALGSLTSLRNVLRELKKVPGDKSLVLISGGWPLEMRESSSELVPIAEVAADARVTIFTLFAASSGGGADRGTISTTPLADQAVKRGPLQTISGMTGGTSYRADIGAGAVFERIARELSGYYRLGVEQDRVDFDGKSRPLKVQVARRGVTVRARELFSGRSYEERDATARLDAALTSPLPSTSIGLRVTTYRSSDPETPSHMRVLLAGEATRLHPGPVTLQLALTDASGNALSSATQLLGDAEADRLPFSTSVSLATGAYIIRAAVVDASGATGSVDHAITVQPTAMGVLSSGDLVLARIPGTASEDTGLVIDRIGQDERLALQVDISGDRERAAAADVVFEVAQADEGPPLLTVEATRLSGSGAALAQGVADTRLLPPGSYVARARVLSDGGVTGVVRRPFVVAGSNQPGDEATRADVAAAGAPAGTKAFVRNSLPISTRVSASLPPFSADHVLAPAVLGLFVDRVAARPDATAPALAPLLARTKATAATDVAVPDAVSAEAPAVAQFLIGLSRLARNQLDPAAQAFRASLRAASDFYPAMVYLGACFAAGGKDLEASAAWQTALIKEGDVPAVHELLIDALLRLKRNDAALEAVHRARERWPDDPSFTRRFVVSAVAAGRYAEGLTALDTLAPPTLDDEPVLALGLQILYESITGAHPVETIDADRVRMRRYADWYQRLNGPSMALVKAWVAAAAPAP